MDKVINGKEISKNIQNELKTLIEETNIKPGLGIILVGDLPDSKVYVRMKKKACERVGIINYDIHFDEIIQKEINTRIL